MALLDRQSLGAALHAAVVRAWVAFEHAHPDDHVYGVGLYTSELAPYVGMTLFSEAGLDQAAEGTDDSGESPDDERAALRWSPCDSPHHLWREDLFVEAQAILDAAADPYDDQTEMEDRVRGAFDVFVDVLRSLDAAGTFGTARAESKRPARPPSLLRSWRRQLRVAQRHERPPEGSDGRARKLGCGSPQCCALNGVGIPIRVRCA